MNTNSTNAVLLRQFNRSWQMFEEVVRQFPAETWRSDEIDYQIPARKAYHIVEGADFLIGTTPEFEWGYRFGGDWEGMKPEDLPSQEAMLTYLEEINPKVEAWLLDLDLMASDEAFPWPGGTLLDRALYLLRHNQHHIGELWAACKQHDLDLPKWH